MHKMDTLFLEYTESGEFKEELQATVAILTRFVLQTTEIIKIITFTVTETYGKNQHLSVCVVLGVSRC